MEVLGGRRGEGIRVGRICARRIAPAAVGTARRPLYEAPHQSDNYNGHLKCNLEASIDSANGKRPYETPVQISPRYSPPRWATPRLGE